MGIVNGSIQIAKKDSTWFTANASEVLKDGQLVFNETTSELFIGDGVTVLSSLTPINGGGTYTFDNGLTESGGTVKLGGTLTQHTEVDGNFSYTIGNNTPLNFFNINVGDSNFSETTKIVLSQTANAVRYDNDATSVSNILSVSDSGTTILSTNSDGTLINTLSIYNNPINISNNGINNNIVLTDEISQKGIVYNSDYSANFTPESLVSKRYVDANIVQVNTSTIGAAINGATSATPNDTDLVMSVDTSVAKKNTWTQIKAFLKTYFDGIYQAAGTYLTSVNITQTITNGVTDKAPSEDAVFDALALKASLTGTETLTNKRVTARVSTTASSATPTPNADTDDEYTVTALAAAATFGAPTGTPTEGQVLLIRVKDNGTARALLFNSIYRFSTDLAAPTTTVINKTLYMIFVYNNTDSKWDCINWINNF
jgi:hypothetical protein